MLDIPVGAKATLLRFYADESGMSLSCNVMEAAGAGFDKITEEYRGADFSHRPYISSASDHFTLVLPDLTYEAGVNDNSEPSLNFVPVPEGSSRDEKILSFCYVQARKASEIAQHIWVADSSYFRKKMLDNLVNHGYLEKSKNGNTVYFKTVSTMVRLN